MEGLPDSSLFEGAATLSLFCLAVSALAALGYLAVTDLGPFRGRAVLKGAAVGALTLYVALSLPPTGAARLAVGVLGLALALSTAGDVFLALPGERSFRHGLFAFLLAHLAYAWLFAGMIRPPVMPQGSRVFGSAALIVLAIAFFFWLWPRLGPTLQRPVRAYIVMLIAMGITALCADFSAPWVPLGAILFIVSDGVLAANRFIDPIRRAGQIVWGTYYVGQCLIVFGYLSEITPAAQID